MRSLRYFSALVAALASLAAANATAQGACGLLQPYFFDKSSSCPGPGREVCNTGRLYHFNTWRSAAGRTYLIGSTYSSGIFYDVTNPLSPVEALDPGGYQPWGQNEVDSKPDDDRQQWDVAMLDGYNYGLAMFQNYGWAGFQVSLDGTGKPTGFTTTDRFRQNATIPTSNPASFARLFTGGDGNVFAVASWLNKQDSSVRIAQFTNGVIGAATLPVASLGPNDALETANIGGTWWLFAYSRNSYSVLIYDLSSITAAALSNPFTAPLQPVKSAGSMLSDFFLDKSSNRLLCLVGGNGAAKLPGTVYVFDVSNPASPNRISTISTAPVNSTVVAGSGNLVVVAQSNSTPAPWIQAFSIINPSSPVEVGAGQLDHTPLTDEIINDLWVSQGAPDYAVYAAAWSAGSLTRISATCLSTDPHAAFTVTGGAAAATCPTTPLTPPSTAAVEEGFPGDTFAITDASYGVIAGKTITIAPAAGGAAVFTSTWNPITGGWSQGLTWAPPASTAPGEYLVTMTATSSTGAPTSTLVQSIFLCGNPVAALAVSAENGVACTTCSSQLLVNDTLNVSAAATTGHPNGYSFYVIPGGAGDLGLLASGSTLASPYTLTAKDTYTFGVVAHYDFPAASPSCGASVPSTYTNANPTAGGYNACSTVTVSADFGVSAFEVWQNNQFAAGPGQPGIILVDQPTTLKFTGKVASGHVPNFVWAIPGVSSSLTCTYTAAPYTGSTCTIPANTWPVGNQVAMNMTLQVCNGSPGVDCGSSSLATIPAPAVFVTPSRYSFSFHVSNPAPAVGQQVAVILDSINGAFSSITVNYGGQACDGTTQGPSLACGNLFGIPGSDPCVVGKTLASFSYSSTGAKSVTASGAVGASSVTAGPVAVNVSAGSCPSQALTVTPSPVAPTVGATVRFTTTPSMSASGDNLTFQFGDGGQQTITYPSDCALGSCVASHIYQGAGTYSVTVSGTVAGLSRTGSASVTVNPAGPGSITVTIAASPASPMAGVNVNFTTNPGVSTTGDSLTFQFGDGTQQVLSYPCPLGLCSLAHTYAVQGLYTVTVAGTVGGIPATGTKQLTVQNPCPYPTAPVANFSWSPVQQRATLPIVFTDLSTGNPTAWSWTFGDGGGIFPQGTSNMQSPAYTYAKEGTYTVTLTVSNCQGQSTKQYQVTVLTACAQSAAPTPDFTWGPTGPLASFPEQSQPYVGQQVTLTDASSNSPTSWHWYDFQEGNVNTTATNPTLTYTWYLPGDKNVRVTATNCFGTSAEKLKIVHIYDDVRHVTADFTWSPADVSTAGATTFNAAQGYANGDPTDFSWSFDDGATATGASVAHTYKCAGNHKVTLTSTRKNASGVSFSATVTKGFTVGGTICGPESVMAVDAAKVLGLNNTNWHADLRIFNASKFATNIWLQFLPAGTDNVQPFTVGPYQPPLPPKGTLVLDDILQWAADNFKQNFTKAALRITYKNDDNVAPIILVRTYNLLPDGSKYGQMNPGVAVVPGTTKSPMWLTGLRNNGTDTGFRTNYSIVNLRGDTSCPSCITFTLFDETGTPIGMKTMGLWAFGYIQDSIKNLFGASFANIGTFSLKIDIPAGQDMQAYASVMDNLTGDPVMITATPPADSPIYLVAIAHNGGVANTVWRTDLQLTNPDGSGPHTWEVKYVPKSQDQLPTVVRSVTLAPYKSLFVNDAVSWAYSGLLPADAETSGVIRIAPTDGTSVYPTVAARSFNQTPTGTFGQGIPALWAARGVSATSDNKRLLLTGMSSEDIARTNLGFLNLSETDGVDMAVYFYDESGNLLNPVNTDGTPAPYTYGNGPGTWDQDKLENRFNRAFKSFGKTLPANLRSISAEIVVRGGGPAFVYASVIDSMTGDPNFIAAQPAP